MPPDVALSKNVLAAVKADRRTVLQLESLVVEREAAAAETRSGWERATAAVNERMQPYQEKRKQQELQARQNRQNRQAQEYFESTASALTSGGQVAESPGSTSLASAP